YTFDVVWINGAQKVGAYRHTIYHDKSLVICIQVTIAPQYHAGTGIYSIINGVNLQTGNFSGQSFSYRNRSRFRKVFRIYLFSTVSQFSFLALNTQSGYNQFIQLGGTRLHGYING